MLAAVAGPFEDKPAGQVVERPGLAGDGDPPVAEVDVAEGEVPDGVGAQGVDGSQGEREPGGRVTAASVAVLIREAGSGRIIVSGRGVPRMRAAGSAKIRPFFLQCLVRDRSAVKTLRRWCPRSAAIAAAASPAVTSRR